MVKVLLSALVFTLLGCSQPNLICQNKNTKADINGVQFYLEVACTDTDKKQGLMYRKSLNTDSGMIFVYNEEDYYAFWMKNTYIPLSIAFLDKDKKIVDIANMQPHDLTPVATRQKALYAVEMSLDWFNSNKIKIGDQLRFVD